MTVCVVPVHRVQNGTRVRSWPNLREHCVGRRLGKLRMDHES